MADVTIYDDVLSFVVPGEPVAKARARTFSGKNGRIVTSTPMKTRAYEKKVRTCCAIAVNHALWTATKKDRFTVCIDIYRTHEGIGGDIDNVSKSILDAIQGEGLAMLNDRYVTTLVASIYVDPTNPRVEVDVYKNAAVAA